jgi:L-asparaginase
VGKPRITLIVTGGTIDTLGEGRLDLFEYARHGRWQTPDEMLAAIPELNDIADIVAIEMPRFGVSSMAMDDLVALHDAVTRAVKEGADGVVVTQGSNYVEENAFFLSLSLRVDRPVALTAAMRPASGMGSDGAMNLVDAVRTASCPDSAAHGVTVVMNGQIHLPRDVVKGHTQALEAFRSPHAGPVGTILLNGRVDYFRQGSRPYPRPFAIDSGARIDWPRVDIVVSYYGGDGALVEAAVRAGARGLVCAGFGAGRPGPGFKDAFDRVAKAGIPVVLAARGSGPVIGHEGLAVQGYIAAGALTPWKARLLLMFSMLHTTDLNVMQRHFEEY